MVEHPVLNAHADGTLILYDRTTVRPERDWRFIGWLLLGAAVAILLSDVRSLSYLTGPSDYLPPLLLGVVGAILIKTGERSRPFLRPLMRITPDRAYIERPLPDRVERTATSDLTHVVFGLIDMPWPGREDVKVEAFALYVSTVEGTPIPIVDGTLDKLETFRIAEFLCDTLELPMIELGKGQPHPHPSRLERKSAPVLDA